MTVGENLIYDFGSTTNALGQEIEVKVELRATRKYASYNAQRN